LPEVPYDLLEMYVLYLHAHIRKCSRNVSGMRRTGKISEYHLLHTGLGRPRADGQPILDRERVSMLSATGVLMHPKITPGMKAR